MLREKCAAAPGGLSERESAPETIVNSQGLTIKVLAISFTDVYHWRVNPDRYTSNPFGEVRPYGGKHGYLAFFPKPLPRELSLAPHTVRLLSDAEAALGQLAGIGSLLPNPHRLMRPYLSLEAIASTRIEGTQASLPELFQLEATDAAPSSDLEEVLNYIRAMHVGLERQQTLPFSFRLLKEVHRTLLAGVRGREREPGELRHSQNWIGAPDATPATALFVPPPPDQLSEVISDWERFANEDSDLPLLARCALLHYQFETIHPFLDGNGRLGRLLIVLFLVVRGRLPGPLLYISPYLEKHRDKYYDCLQAVREKGAIDTWLNFFLAGVATQATNATTKAEKLVSLREHYRHALKATTQPHATALIDIIFEIPVLTTRLVEHRLQVTRPTALKLLRHLTSHKILREDAIGPRGQIWWFADDVLAAIQSTS